MQAIDIPALIVLSSPVWVVLGVGVAVVCIQGAGRLGAGEAPGWQTPIVAWVTSALLLWLPMVIMTRTVRYLGLATAYAAFATFPFLITSVVLNKASTKQHSVRKRAWVAAAAGMGGIAATLGMTSLLGYTLGFEMYP